MSESFRKKIRNLRLERHLTLEELAKLVDSTKAYIWQLENKAKAKPSGELLVKLSDALGVSPNFLIEDDRETPMKKDVANVLFRKMEQEDISYDEMLEFIDVVKKIRNRNE